MALPVEEVLALWREAERLLEALPVGAADRAVVTAEVVTLKSLYTRLTGEAEASSGTIRASHATVRATRSTLEGARLRLESGH